MEDLVADDAGRAIRWRRVDAMGVHVRLGARDEECPSLVQHIRAGKVDMAAAHDVGALNVTQLLPSAPGRRTSRDRNRGNPRVEDVTE